jgi:hypothetical protein
VIRREGHLCVVGQNADAEAVRPLSSLQAGVVFANDEATAERLSSQPQLLNTADAAYSIHWIGAAEHTSLLVDAVGLTLRPCVVRCGAITLEIAAGTVVTLDDDGLAYVVDGSKGGVNFGHADGANRAIVHEPVKIAAAGNADAGQVTARVKISAGLLDMSVRYFYPAADATAKVAGFTYPILQAPPSGEVEVTVHAHPAVPDSSAKNRLQIESASAATSNFATVAGEPLQLIAIPGESGTTTQWDPALGTAYTAPLGNWRLAPASGPSGPSGPPMDLMCGLSGLEFAKVDPQSVVRFVPDAPAYAPGFGAASATGPAALSGSLVKTYPGATHDVTTSWVYIVAYPSTSVPGYYSQPIGSGLFQPTDQGLLKVLQISCAQFPANAQPIPGVREASFPMVPYLGVSVASAKEASLCKNFEIELLSPTRCNAIFAMNWPNGSAGPVGFSGIAGLQGRFASVTGPSGHMAVTPQGLLSWFSGDYSGWLQLLLGATNQGAQTLMLQDLNAQLRAALMTSQLFLVVSNVTEFKKYCRVLFSTLNISGWRFNLDVTDWDKNPDDQSERQTVMILKFADKTLKELVYDISLWSSAANGLNDQQATQRQLIAWLEEAENKREEPEFEYFRNTVLGDWNGVIFANVKVPPTDFPPQLQALAPGIDLSKLQAHHVGVNLSPIRVVENTIQVSDSSIFGLIYYEDKQDLVYSSAAYDFKVLSLRVLFANSEIASFSSQIELLVAELFSQRSTLKNSLHGDNIILNGVMQRHGDEESYSFTEQGTNTFAIESKVLDTVVVDKAQFVTLQQDNKSPVITARFLMSGTMSFLDHPEFDMLSFGAQSGAPPAGPVGLQFSNMFVSMNYAPTGPTGITAPTGPSGITGPTGQTGPIGPTVQPQTRTFAFEAGQMSFNLSRSVARPSSMYARFPLQVTGMVQGNSKTTPASLGFMQVDTALASSSLGSNWYGLKMQMSLGSQGGLASMAGFYATLLAVWAPSKRDYNAMLTLQLPGSQGGSRSMTIEGPLKLTIQDIGMRFDSGDHSYMLRFGNIALTLFSLRFPPGGKTNLLLFGDPDPSAVNTTLGWYAAYMKNPEKSDKKDSSVKARALRRRAPKTIEGVNAKAGGCDCGDESPVAEMSAQQRSEDK